MNIEKIHSYLTHPAKLTDEKPKIRGASVPKDTKLFAMLESTFNKSEKECNIDIAFIPDSGKQQNPIRTIIINYIKNQTLPNGRKLANELQNVTTHRSGIGLLFLVLAKEGKKRRLLISRFPADVGVLAREDGEELSVEFVEEVFMKNSKSYKSVVFQDSSLTKGFWDGLATDKQLAGDSTTSEYWVHDFLQSQLKTTSAAGTRRFANAIRKAGEKNDDLEIKSELASLAQLMRNLPNRKASISSLCNRFNLSKKSKDAVFSQVPNPDTVTEQFIFSKAEFAKHIHYRAMELDNGARLVADAAKFNDIFKIKTNKFGKVSIATEGEVIHESLRKAK